MANFNIISSTLKQVLDFIVSIVGNYGWSVVIFTLLIRLLLMPLDIKSKKSMKRTTALQPKMNELQKKYAKDKDKLNQKMQELYKKEGINPLSGCLPMLLQLPIMFCMFTAIRVAANEHTVQMLLDMMNNNPIVLQSCLWVKNVFQPDSFMSTILPMVGDGLQQLVGVTQSAILTQANVDAVREFVKSQAYVDAAATYGINIQQMWFHARLPGFDLQIPMQFNGLLLLPVLAGVTTFLSSKLMTPPQAAADGSAAPAAQGSAQSTNQMMTWMMPVISLFFCITSSTAFSMYWVASNLIQLVQQYLVNLYFDRKGDDVAKPEEVIQP